MRALVADPSAIPPLRLATVPEPSPAAGQVLVRVEAASVNRGEVRAARHRAAGAVIGWDVAGTVLTRGSGVEGLEVGQRVVGLTFSGGGFAEMVALPAAWTAPLPDACDFVRASTLPVAGITAVGILRTAKVGQGDRVLVTGAAGGVGHLAIQLARQAGAVVTGQASSAQRAEPVRAAGATPLLHPGDGSPLTGEFDVVLDGIGGAMLPSLFHATVPLGRVVLYGNSADAASTFRVEDVYGKALTVYGFRVFTSVPPEQAVQDLAALAEQVVAGTLDTHVQATASLEDSLGLVRALVERRVAGKVVIVPTG